MAITVSTKNGATVEFPDGTDSETIRQVMGRATGAQPAAPSKPIIGTNLADLPNSAARGIYKGAAEIATLPYRALDWAGEKITGTGFLPNAEDMSLWGGLMNPPPPQSKAGEYLQGAGQAVGSSILPTGVALGMAGRAVSGPAASTFGQIGQQIVQGARSNPGQFVAMDAAGSVTGGLAQQAAADAGANPGWQAIAGMAGGMAPGVVGAVRSPGGVNPGSPTAQGIARQRLNEAQIDAQAFANQEVRPFGPAFNQGPVASIGRQLTETPFVGAPLRNNLDETITDTGNAVRRLADNIAPTANYEQAGTGLQRGLDRYRTSGLDQLEPGTVQALGISPTTHNVPNAPRGGQGQMQRIQQAQPAIQQITGGQVQNNRGASVPLPTTRAQRPTQRTTVADLTDTELQTVIRAPSDATSFGARSEALYEKAWRGLPPPFNDTLLPTANAGNVVRGIITNEARTGVTAGLPGRYEQMFETLSNPSANTTLDTLRQMRTQIGRELSNFGTYEASLDRNQLSQLYGGLTSDIEIGLQDIAARAAAAFRMSRAYITRQQAQRAVQALRDFQVADRYFRQGIDRMDRFARLANAENPQQAAASMIGSASDGIRGNARMVRSAMGVLRPEERAQFGALIVREMGAPKPGGRGIVQEAQFSPSRFVTNYNAMSPDIRAMVFSPEHNHALDDLFRIANRISNVEALTNTSRSGTNALNLGGVGTAIAYASTGDIATPLLIGGSGYLASIMMSTPQYTRWMTQYLRLRAGISDGSSRTASALVRHIMGLEQQARYNPELWPVFMAISAENGTDNRRLN